MESLGSGVNHLVNKDEEEDMAFEEDSSDSDDSEKEREEHYALERKIVELRKEVSLCHSVNL